MARDLSGMHFGRLAVIEKSEKRASNGSIVWKCRCSCGKEVAVSSPSLLNKQTTSCGCYAKEMSSKANTGRMVTKVHPSLHPTIKDIYWAAGIYEGEGHCNFSSGTQRLAVTQKDPWILLRLQSLFGGTIGSHKDRSINTWTLNGVRARGLLMTLYSLLSPRRQEQVRMALGGK